MVKKVHTEGLLSLDLAQVLSKVAVLARYFGAGLSQHLDPRRCAVHAVIERGDLGRGSICVVRRHRQLLIATLFRHFGPLGGQLLPNLLRLLQHLIHPVHLLPLTLDLLLLALARLLDTVLDEPPHLPRLLQFEDIANVLKQLASHQIINALSFDLVLHLNDLTNKCILKAVLQVLSLFDLNQFLLQCLEAG